MDLGFPLPAPLYPLGGGDVLVPLFEKLPFEYFNLYFELSIFNFFVNLFS